MHAGVRGPEKGSRQPGCHRATVPASDGVCLRATCGRDATGEWSGLTPATLRAPSRLALTLVREAETVQDFRFTWLAPPAPPTDPPRSVRG